MGNDGRITDLNAWKETRGDYIVRATAAGGYIRAFAACTRGIAEEARKIHGTSPVATAALGRLLTAAAMMGLMMKSEDDLLTVIVRGDGPIGGITVTADASGRVKGFPYQPDVLLHANAKGKLDVGGAVGRGTLTVVKDLRLKEPYSGTVDLQTGEIGDDITYYFLTSEQVPSSIGLGVLMDRGNTVRQAGGFIIQLMPGVPDETVGRLEETLSGVQSVTSMLEAGLVPEGILEQLLRGMEPEILGRTPASWYCGCSRERVSRALVSLGRAELERMIGGNEPAELQCHFCRRKYRFSVRDIRALLDGQGQTEKNV